MVQKLIIRHFIKGIVSFFVPYFKVLKNRYKGAIFKIQEGVLRNAEFYVDFKAVEKLQNFYQKSYFLQKKKRKMVLSTFIADKI
jgi:hypothetical protein